MAKQLFDIGPCWVSLLSIHMHLYVHQTGMYLLHLCRAVARHGSVHTYMYALEYVLKLPVPLIFFRSRMHKTLREICRKKHRQYSCPVVLLHATAVPENSDTALFWLGRKARRILGAGSYR
jgi:hypothetical protein